MKNILFTFILFGSILMANSNIIQAQNVLTIQNIVQNEEDIATNFEKYLLREYKLPSIDDLVNDEYLGKNFSKKNIFGLDIDFLEVENLKIKYAITKDVPKYVIQLYDRDLYRYSTQVYTSENSKYVLMKLKTTKAQNIFELLKSGFVIETTCTDDLSQKYCNKNDKTLRWYELNSNWIEYDKEDLQGDVTISSEILLSNVKLNSLRIGSFIYVLNGYRYIKLNNNEILRVK